MWQKPEARTFENNFVKIYPLDFEKHSLPLFEAAAVQNNNEDIFKYVVSTGPFETLEQFRAYLLPRTVNRDILMFTVESKRLQKIVGSFTLQDFSPEHGRIEVGSIWYCKDAQRSEINTATMYEIFSYIFDTLQYRRLAWRCNNKNEGSKNAALRLGFTFEGVFRNHYFDKGQNRDTAWYSIIQEEWSSVKALLRKKLGS